MAKEPSRRRRRWKRNLVVLVCMGILLLVCRGPLFRALVTYRITGQRTTYAITNPQLLQYMDASTQEFKPRDVRDIIRKSLHITTRCLHFRQKHTISNPNVLVVSRRAHCVGYAAFFTTVCDHLLNQYGYGREWKARPLVARIWCCGMNLHVFFTSPFFRDHDFAVVENTRSGQQYFVDPVVSDYLRINSVHAR